MSPREVTRNSQSDDSVSDVSASHQSERSRGRKAERDGGGEIAPCEVYANVRLALLVKPEIPETSRGLCSSRPPSACGTSADERREGQSAMGLMEARLDAGVLRMLFECPVHASEPASRPNEVMLLTPLVEYLRQTIYA